MLIYGAEMSDIQGIIVSGEASESDEEEEFCAAIAKGQLVNQRLAGGTDKAGTRISIQNHQQAHQQLKRTQSSLLHQKLWETNMSLSRNLSHCVQGPIREKAERIAHLTASLPAAQTSSLTAHSAFTQSNRNLSRLNFLLTGLKDNPLMTLKTI